MDENNNPKFVDMTPSWSTMLPLMLTVYCTAKGDSKRDTEIEFKRMAELADKYVELEMKNRAAYKQKMDKAGDRKTNQPSSVMPEEIGEDILPESLINAAGFVSIKKEEGDVPPTLDRHEPPVDSE